jgi:photosystem II stability/assembly factor-like uncharacterized protein
MKKTLKYLLFSVLFLTLAGCSAQTAAPTAISDELVQQAASATLTAESQLQPSATPASQETAAPVATAAPEATSAPADGRYPHLAAGTPLNIYSVKMIDAQNGWGIGGDGAYADHVLRTADGGHSWQDATPPEKAPAAPNTKAAVGYFSDMQNAWVVYYSSSFSDPSALKPIVWHTSNGGAEWTPSVEVDISDDESFIVDSMQFVDANNGWYLAHVGAGMSHDYIQMFHTTDAGSTWTIVIDPMKNQDLQGCYKTGFTFSDVQNGWLTGDCNGVKSGLFLQHTTDGGAAWTEVSLPAPSDTPDLYTREDVDCGSYYPRFIDDKNGRLAVKCTYAGEDPARVVNYLYTTADAGGTWSISSYPGGQLSFSSLDSGLALGQQVNATGDGGNTWTKLTDLNWDGVFSMADAANGLAYSKKEGKSVLYTTSDGAKTWTQVDPVIGQ